VNRSDQFRSPQKTDIDCDLCIAGGESVPTQDRCVEARAVTEDYDMTEDDDVAVRDAAQRPAGRPPMRSMLLRRAGERS
jgi:hypothetical protein